MSAAFTAADLAAAIVEEGRHAEVVPPDTRWPDMLPAVNVWATPTDRYPADTVEVSPQPDGTTGIEWGANWEYTEVHVGSRAAAAAVVRTLDTTATKRWPDEAGS